MILAPATVVQLALQYRILKDAGAKADVLKRLAGDLVSEVLRSEPAQTLPVSKDGFVEMEVYG